LPEQARATELLNCIVLPEKKRRCSIASLRFRGLSKRRPCTDATESLPMTQSPSCERLTSAALKSARAVAISWGSFSFSKLLTASSFSFDGYMVNSSPAASSIWRRMALDEARIRAKRTTLWKSLCAGVARTWGCTQSAACPCPRRGCSKIHPRGRFLSPACESRDEIGPTRAITEGARRGGLLAIRETLPKPRSPAANHINNIRF